MDAFTAEVMVPCARRLVGETTSAAKAAASTWAGDPDEAGSSVKSTMMDPARTPVTFTRLAVVLSAIATSAVNCCTNVARAGVPVAPAAAMFSDSVSDTLTARPAAAG
jgi:hypothetical protein